MKSACRDEQDVVGPHHATFVFTVVLTMGRMSRWTPRG
jgi:hypothetical protein